MLQTVDMHHGDTVWQMLCCCCHRVAIMCMTHERFWLYKDVPVASALLLQEPGIGSKPPTPKRTAAGGPLAQIDAVTVYFQYKEHQPVSQQLVRTAPLELL